MDYRGYKIKETTAIGAFDVPRKMLVWGERGKGKNESPKVDTVSARVRLDAGVYALTTAGAFYEHCADIPLEAQLDDATAEYNAIRYGGATVYLHDPDALDALLAQMAQTKTAPRISRLTRAASESQ